MINVTRVVGMRVNTKGKSIKRPWFWDIVELEAVYKPKEGQEQNWVWVVRDAAPERALSGVPLVLAGQRFAKEKGLEFDPSAVAGCRPVLSDITLLAQALEPERDP